MLASRTLGLRVCFGQTFDKHHQALQVHPCWFGRRHTWQRQLQRHNAPQGLTRKTRHDTITIHHLAIHLAAAYNSLLFTNRRMFLTLCLWGRGFWWILTQILVNLRPLVLCEGIKKPWYVHGMIKADLSRREREREREIIHVAVH